MSKLLVEVVSKIKAVIEPFSRTAAGITSPDKTKLYSVSYFGKTIADVVTGVYFTFYNLLFGDTTSISETKSVEFGKGVSDTPSVLEAKSADLNKPIQDSLNLTDSLSSETYFIRDFLDNYNVSDSANLLFLKSSIENIEFQDNFTRVFNSSRSFFDQVSVPTDIKIIDLNKVHQDQLNLTDSFNSETAFIRNYLDSYSVSDNKEFLFLKSSNEIVGFEDIFTKIFDRNRSFFDEVSATDDINGTAVDDDQIITFFTSKADFTNIGEYISFENSFIRQLVETAAVSSSGTILLQSYTDGPGYFLEDYVGVSKTIT